MTFHVKIHMYIHHTTFSFKPFTGFIYRWHWFEQMPLYILYNLSVLYLFTHSSIYQGRQTTLQSEIITGIILARHNILFTGRTGLWSTQRFGILCHRRLSHVRAREYIYDWWERRVLRESLDVVSREKFNVLPAYRQLCPQARSRGDRDLIKWKEWP